MPELDQILKSIDARLAELQTEIAALESARAALRGSSAGRATAAPRSTKPAAAAPRRRNARSVGNGRSGGGLQQTHNGAGAAPEPAGDEAPSVKPAEPARKPRPRTQATRSKRSARAVDALLGGKLEAMLGEAEDGLSAVTVSKRSNVGYNAVLELLRKLESAGQVRRTGARRTSLWRLITDEERIAARAAELEKLAASSPS